MVFNDVGNTLTGNDVLLYYTNGQIVGLGGLPEAEFDQFRRAVKAVIP